MLANQFFGLPMPRRLRSRAESETTTTETEKQKPMKSVELTDPETGMIVTVQIPIDTPQDEEEIVANAVVAMRKKHQREADRRTLPARAREAQRNIMNQVKGGRP